MKETTTLAVLGASVMLFFSVLAVAVSVEKMYRDPRVSAMADCTAGFLVTDEHRLACAREIFGADAPKEPAP